MQKTKKQHYVPRCYLKAFLKPGTRQVHVYDKEKRKARINNYEDVASENYFHDLSDEGRASIEEMLKSHGLQSDIDTQFIERFFAEGVEPIFSEFLEKLREAANAYTPWYDQECLILRSQEKVMFSIMLAFQYIRTKAARNRIYEIVDCMQQFLETSKTSSKLKMYEELESMDIDEFHKQMLLDVNSVSDLSSSFLRLTWMLGVNKTGTPIITSDNPIVTRTHNRNRSMSMPGVGSKGVEIAFPIAPNAILILFDSAYFGGIPIKDKAFVQIEEDMVEDYNSLQAFQSSRLLFSAANDFSIIDRLLEKHPDIFEKKATTLTNGRRVFHPRADRMKR